MKQVKIRINDLNFSYNGRLILQNTNIEFPENQISAIIGPSGSGKSTFLTTLNRLWETISGCSMDGSVEIRFGEDFEDIYHPGYCVTELRRRVGMVFQLPNPLPMSIYKNVALPLELAGGYSKEEIRIEVEKQLKMAGLWKEVCERLNHSALELSGGQQQRLCIARALILQPDVLLLDEPTSSLDHEAARAIEELLLELKNECTLLMVSHYSDQVRRIADTVIELKDGILQHAPKESIRNDTS